MHSSPLAGDGAVPGLRRGDPPHRVLHFPNEQAALKVLYLAICSLDPTGCGKTRLINRWKGALNAFDIAFDGRIIAGRR